MGLTKIFVLALILSLIPIATLASEVWIARMGVDMTHYQSGSIYSVGWQDDIADNFVYHVDIGAWTDSKDGHRSSPYVGLLFGPRIGSYRSFNATCKVGIMAIGFPDAALSTPFQFTEECSVGYRQVSLGYKHISNAGIKEPNLGRDYIFLGWTIPLTF